MAATVAMGIRRDQWRKKSVREYHDKAVRPVSTSDPEAAFIAKNMVWQALNILSPRRRAIVVMYELEGLAIPPIAALPGITTITVRWHLSVAKRDLTGALKVYRGDLK